MKSKQTDSKKWLRCKPEQKEKKPAENNGLESYLKLSAPEKDYLKNRLGCCDPFKNDFKESPKVIYKSFTMRDIQYAVCLIFNLFL